MKPFPWILSGCLWAALSPAGSLRMTSLTPQGDLVVTNSFTNGVLTIERSPAPGDSWTPERNVFSIASTSRVSLAMTNRMEVFRAKAVDLSGAQGAWTLAPEDVIDLVSLAARLNVTSEGDPVSGYVA